jgi:hypothetical protein
MTPQAMTQQQIRAEIEILSRHMVITEMIRFLQRTETGYGDYMQEREAFLGDPMLEDWWLVSKEKATTQRETRKKRKTHDHRSNHDCRQNA